MSRRYALYFAPAADSSLARFGEFVLGRTAETARNDSASSTFPDKARWLELTRSPAHYGFHATLKAPFELSDTHNLSELIARVEEFADSHDAVPLPGLKPRPIAHFAALTLENQPGALRNLAQSVVESFESFRRPLSSSDIQRRKAQPLSARQIELLEQFGYPYVDEEFRFHMTLSGALTEQDQDYIHWLQDAYQQKVNDTPLLDQLAIYGQTSRSAAFVRLCSYPLKTH